MSCPAVTAGATWGCHFQQRGGTWSDTQSRRRLVQSHHATHTHLLCSLPHEHPVQLCVHTRYAACARPPTHPTKDGIQSSGVCRAAFSALELYGREAHSMSANGRSWAARKRGAVEVGRDGVVSVSPHAPARGVCGSLLPTPVRSFTASAWWVAYRRCGEAAPREGLVGLGTDDAQ
jgi:hypothetical protein